MLEHQECKIKPYEIADISYDLSVRDGTINHIADDLDEMIQKALESLKINAISTTVTDGSYELEPTRAGIHPRPSIPGYTWSHTSIYSPFALRHIMVRTGGTP